MSSRLSFTEIMKQRHSVRHFLSKPIPKETLKIIIETSLLTPSWGNSQPWTIYVASGNTLDNIRKDWIAKNKEGIKGNSEIEAGHRRDFSERCQNCMNEILKQFGDVLNDPNAKEIWEANANYLMLLLLFMLQFLRKGHFIIFLTLVLLKFLLWSLLKNIELILYLLMKP